MTTVPAGPDYRKSSYSGTDSSCVEVRRDLGAFRDSKNKAAGDMPVNPVALRAFVQSFKPKEGDSEGGPVA